MRETQNVEELMLPQRTVRYALTELEREDLVEKRLSFRDARQRLYLITETDTEWKLAAP